VASGRVLWKHEHKLPEELPSLARLIPMNRGAALYKDKVYFGTLDAHLIALKAATGEVAWKTKVADALDGYFFTIAPARQQRHRPVLRRDDHWHCACSPGGPGYYNRVESSPPAG
jgi:glucose dehydrogenase